MFPPRLAVRSALLVSDSHVDTDRPALTAALCDWLSAQCQGGSKEAAPDALVILGDLVDAWVGDDALAHPTAGQAARSLVACLRGIADAGIAVHIMHGNRDFLIGEHFAQACGAQLLQDPAVLSIANGPAVAITHGDQLCTADHAYQAFRNQVRSASWQQDFLAKPLPERLAIARHLRETSEIEKSGKAMTIMDVTPRDCELLIDRLDADMLLHGHTHRPGCSTLPNGKVRWVLPDWECDGRGGLARGGGLWVDAAGIRKV